MTILELMCILCGAGWAVSLVSFALLCLAGHAIRGHRLSSGATAVIMALISLTAGGFVGCAAEDRVCDVAKDG